MNLVVEYAKRRKQQLILGTNDGVCFLDFAMRPRYIMLTGRWPRCTRPCYQCSSDGGMIVELLTSCRDEGFSCLSHRHVSPDTNLLQHANDVLLKPLLSPYYAACHADLEFWLWRFFIVGYRFSNRRSYSAFLETQTAKEPACYVEQMAWIAQRAPRAFSRYYELYESTLAGRNYLLYG